MRLRKSLDSVNAQTRSQLTKSLMSAENPAALITYIHMSLVNVWEKVACLQNIPVFTLKQWEIK